MSSRGKRSCRSVSAAVGFTRASAKARSVSRRLRWVSVSSTCTLLALPERRPLVEERPQALDPILGGEGDPEGLDLEAAAGGPVGVDGDLGGALRLPERDRRLGGQRRRQRG